MIIFIWNDWKISHADVYINKYQIKTINVQNLKRNIHIIVCHTYTENQAKWYDNNIEKIQVEIITFSEHHKNKLLDIKTDISKWK